MIVEEIAIVTEDEIVIVTEIEIVIETDDDQDRVTENALDHVIGNTENKPLPFTIEISLLDCKNFNLFRNEIYSCSSWRFKLVCYPTGKTSTTTTVE